MITFRSLSRQDPESIVAVFNEAFSDYLVKVQVTEESLMTKMKQESIDLEWSVGVFDNDKLVGFILNGYRASDSRVVLYNGGTGVIPSYRGRAFTKQMYDHLLPIAKRAGIKELVLEVIQQNEKALHVYLDLGFKIERELISFAGPRPSFGKPKEIEIRELISLPPEVQDWWDYFPSWPADNFSLMQVENDLLIAGAFHEDHFVGYLAAMDNTGRIFQLAVSPRYRKRKIATSLISYCFDVRGFNSMLALNVDIKDQAGIAFYKLMGWKESVRQYEMKRFI
jgi:ribosomal protein S18 acetylase RimI-like enzyme